MTARETLLKKHLRDLVRACETALKVLDEEMHKPSTLERGQRVAQICNALELQKDCAKHFGLGKRLRKTK